MNRKLNRNLQKMTLASLLAAMTTVATMLIRIPTPTKGYVNLGDGVVNIAAWLLGPVYGAAAAGIGSSLADIISGYVIYAPATLIIKAAMAIVSYFVFTKLVKKLNSFSSRIIAAVLSEIVMTTGYFFFESALYGSFLTALTGVPSNIVQGAIGAAVSILLYELVVKRAVKFAK